MQLTERCVRRVACLELLVLVAWLLAWQSLVESWYVEVLRVTVRHSRACVSASYYGCLKQNRSLES